MKPEFVFKKLAQALAILFVSASFVAACSDYVHLWRPVSEKKSVELSSEGIALLLARIINVLPANEAKWQICVNPASQMVAELKASIALAVESMEPSRVEWGNDLSPFDGNSSDKAAIWLDFVDPVHQYYWWQDENKPPLAMFRSGELDTAVVRVMARDSAGKIVLIEEFKHLFQLESDFMLPGWIGVASAWPRRLSLQTGFANKRHEWTFSVPPDLETINQIPSDVVKFYFGESSSDQILINSDY